MQLPTTMARGRRLQLTSTILICSIVIALCSATVIPTVQCTSISGGGDNAEELKPVAAGQPQTNSSPLEPATKVEAKLAEQEPAKPIEPATKSADEQARKGRSEAPSSEQAKQSPTEKPVAAASPSQESSSKPAAGSKSSEQKQSTGKPAAPSSSSGNSSKQQLSGKSGPTPATINKRLPANLGTVTSTGSGGPAHYMSKHDAYSAIAEKHGALAQDAMRKSDNRQHNNLQQRFSGIQKASGIGDALNPFKGVTDSGLARSKYQLSKGFVLI